jgi:hypothetical protein
MAIFLLIVPVASLLFKTFYLELPLLPPRSGTNWVVSLQIHSDFFENSQAKFNPIPSTRDHQRIKLISVDHQGIPFKVVETPQGSSIQWDRTPSGGIELTFLAEIEEIQLPRLNEMTSHQFRRPPRSRLPQLSETELQLVQELEQMIYVDTDSAVEKLRKIYFHITEEVLLNPLANSMEDTLRLSEGSNWLRAKLFEILALRAGILANTILVANLNDDSRISKNRYRLSFVNEVFLNNKWHPVDVHHATMGVFSSDQIWIARNPDVNFPQLIEDTDQIHLLAEPARMNPLNSMEYSVDLQKKSSFLSWLSLYDLPLSIQAVLKTLLLLPLGTLVLSFARSIVGISTFGIFVPILLSLFFLETSFLVGIIFFGVICLLGLAQRYGLARMRLLAVPRLSILLSCVILGFTFFALLSSRLSSVYIPYVALTYFPIVIVTIFIERFSVAFVEEGLKNTAQRLLGTLVISIMGYLLFRIEGLQVLVYTNPEIIFGAIGLNILIGRYNGYRLSELIRFKDLSKGEHA